MAHANARLTIHGKVILIHRVVVDERPVAHVAKELGISRQCAHRWVRRFRTEATTGLVERCSRPKFSPRRTDLLRGFRSVGPLKMRVLLEERAACPHRVGDSRRSSKKSCAVR